MYLHYELHLRVGFSLLVPAETPTFRRWTNLIFGTMSSFQCMLDHLDRSLQKMDPQISPSIPPVICKFIWVFPKIGVFPPKSSILIGFGNIINHPFWGTLFLGWHPYTAQVSYWWLGLGPWCPSYSSITLEKRSATLAASVKPGGFDMSYVCI